MNESHPRMEIMDSAQGPGTDDSDYSLETLLAKVKEHSPLSDMEKISKAYHYAEEAHQGQKRRSGEPYFIHPVTVAGILAELGMDTDSIVSGLLHDVLEDTEATYAMVEKEFGRSVADLVNGVTRLGKIAYSSKEESQMEDLRKMFIAMARDIRVIIIKLADRLHNARTFKFLPEQKQRDKSLETMEIYAPLAHRLGIDSIKCELEDICIKYLDPVGYGYIMDEMAGKTDSYEQFLQRVKARISEKLQAAGIACEMKARVKHVYSIYRKMYIQNLTFSEMYDICAVRVIVEKLTDCYNVLGFVHDLYRPIPGRFKDYISNPKPNGYQSLHTVAIGREGIPFEVQIRTQEMDRTAEYGVAAHWKYKDGLKGKQNEQTFAWIRQLLESQQDTQAEDFIKNIKVDLFSEEVFVFTPKGDVINLPAGATPIDFAYAIHSAVGNRMTGAKVNGRLVPIDYELKTGEIVEVVTSKETNGPGRDWLKLAKTAEARNKIKQWFKKERREENIQQGQAALERELKIALLYQDFQREEVYGPVIRRFNFATLEDLYASIGYGGVSCSKVMIKVQEEIERLNRHKTKIEDPKLSLQKKRATSDSGVIVEGVDNCLVKFSKCCTPIPGDNIVGFVTRGYGVSIHRTECANVAKGMENTEEYGRWVRVSWDPDTKFKFSTGIHIRAKAQVGMLADIMQIFSVMKINVTEMNVRDSEGLGHYFCTLEVNDREQLESILNRIRKVHGVVEATRIMAGK